MAIDTKKTAATDEDLVEVRVEAGTYLQVDQQNGKEVDVPRKRGDVIKIPRAELARVPWAFTVIAEERAQAAAVDRPPADPWFEKTRAQVIEGFNAQEQARKIQVASELEDAKAALEALGR